MTTEAAAQFESLAALYEDMARWPFRRDLEIPSVLRTIGDVRGKDILDFGCGTGMYARWLKKRGARRAVGFDLTDGMLEFARRKAKEDKCEITFTDELTSDLQGQFDVVLAIYVLPYATNTGELAAMCASMTGLLRPGGRLITLPIHPDYHPDPEFYRSQGFSYCAEDPVNAPHKDGGKIRVELCRGDMNASFDAWYWSEKSINDAMKAAGIWPVKWHELAPDSAHADTRPSGHTQAYYGRPNAIITEGVLARTSP